MKSLKNFGFLLGLFLLGAEIVQAAPHPLIKLQGQGDAQGGQARHLMSLINLRVQDKGAKELLTLEFGDPLFAPLQGAPGYFHVEIKEKPARMIVTLALTQNSLIDSHTLIERLRASKLIKKGSVFFDPPAQALSVEFDLKRPIAARTQPIVGQNKRPAGLLIEISSL